MNILKKGILLFLFITTPFFLVQAKTYDFYDMNASPDSNGYYQYSYGNYYPIFHSYGINNVYDYPYNNNYSYYNDYNYRYDYRYDTYRTYPYDVDNGNIYFYNDQDSSSNNDEPEVSIDDANDIDEESAELSGEVDMNDYKNGIVFFVYGEDEDQVEDIADDYDSYSDIDEDGDDLQKVKVDSDLDDSEDYEKNITRLDDDTKYYFSLCVEYEDEDGDDTLECSKIENFRTDDQDSSSNNDEPEVSIDDANDIDEESAELSGEVDMNDYKNGIVFFVYGEDEDQVEDIADDYDSYSDIDEDGDDLQKVKVDSDLDDSEDYEKNITRLDDDTKYYFSLCVEYEDEDGDDTLECSKIENFRTDN